MSTRVQILEQADELFYRNGFNATSFAHIAAAVGITRGNFYHHFKSKDALLEAVIERRLANTREMLARWSAQADTPRARIGCFIRILLVNRSGIMAWGCPVGSLSTELAKLEHLAQPRAAAIFSLFADWLAGEFAAHGARDDSAELAHHLLGRVQGVAVMMAAFRDEAFMHREVAALEAWLDALPRVAPSP